MSHLKNIALATAGLLASVQVGAQSPKSLYEFEVTTIKDSTFSLSELRGKKVLIVNTASKCGYTKQYAGLQSLYERYGGESFAIIGFPSNNFRGQEPGTNAEIADFCKINYGVTFPMMAKIDVVGENQAPLYRWLTKKSENGVMDSAVKWNFQKYLIDENGQLVGVVETKEDPEGERIVEWIKSGVLK